MRLGIRIGLIKRRRDGMFQPGEIEVSDAYHLPHLMPRNRDEHALDSTHHACYTKTVKKRFLTTLQEILHGLRYTHASQKHLLSPP